MEASSRGKLQGFRSSVPETSIKDQRIEQKDASSISVTQEITSVLEILCQSQATRTSTCISYCVVANKRGRGGTSLVVQWLRLCLPMQGLWV